MKQYTDTEVREMANTLGDWIAEDATLHIPLDAPVQREELGAWVDCKVLVRWPGESKTN